MLGVGTSVDDLLAGSRGLEGAADLGLGPTPSPAQSSDADTARPARTRRGCAIVAAALGLSVAAAAVIALIGHERAGRAQVEEIVDAQARAARERSRAMRSLEQARHAVDQALQAAVATPAGPAVGVAAADAPTDPALTGVRVDVVGSRGAGLDVVAVRAVLHANRADLARCAGLLPAELGDVPLKLDLTFLRSGHVGLVRVTPQARTAGSVQAAQLCLRKATRQWAVPQAKASTKVVVPLVRGR